VLAAIHREPAERVVLQAGYTIRVPAPAGGQSQSAGVEPRSSSTSFR
jgi:hypothetical protein